MFTPQELANTAWAFASVTRPEPELFTALAGVAERWPSEFKPQVLANMAWAFATAEIVRDCAA